MVLSFSEEGRLLMTGLRLIFTAGLMLGVSACSTGVNGERIFGNEESMAWHHNASDQTKLNFFTVDVSHMVSSGERLG